MDNQCDLVRIEHRLETILNYKGGTVVIVLELYAAVDLSPWPDDIPSDHLKLGSFEIDEFERLRIEAAECFAALSLDLSFFADWIVPVEVLPSLIQCLEEKVSSATRGKDPLRKLVAMLDLSEGRQVLAVCD